MFNGTIKLGKFAGIPLSANWSVAFIATLLTVSLATGILPAAAAGIAPVAAWLLGLIGAGLFLASLLAHELGHSVVARRAGVPVKEITLWMFGGVAKLGSEARTADDELRIAAAGPAVSAALAAGFGATSFALAAAGLPAALVALVGWLAVVNAVLAIFNLLPGLPLDGGRILRAWLWKSRGDRASATVTAASAGQVVGGGLMGLGLLQFLGGGAGLWTAAIGFMLFSAARSELAGRPAFSSARPGLFRSPFQPPVSPNHPSMSPYRSCTATAPTPPFATDASVAAPVSSVMEPAPPVVSGDATATWLAPVLDHGNGYYLLHDAHDRIVGLVTLDQVRRVPLHLAASTTLASIAHTIARGDLLVVSPDQTIPAGPGGYLVVFDGPRLVGVVTPHDVPFATSSAGAGPFATSSAGAGHSHGSFTPQER